MDLEKQVIEVERNGRWNRITPEDIKPGEVFRIQPLKKRMGYTAYLHGSKEANYTKADEFGLSDNETFMREFEGSLYEISLDMEVDTETGETWVLGIYGVELKEPVKV